MRTNKQGQTTKQLALPARLRQRVMKLAHAGVMSWHQGVHRTIERVSKSFWWPGMSNDVNMLALSCDICQRTISKGLIPHVNQEFPGIHVWNRVYSWDGSAIAVSSASQIPKRTVDALGSCTADVSISASSYSWPRQCGSWLSQQESFGGIN